MKEILLNSAQHQYMDINLIDEVAIGCKYCLLMSRHAKVDEQIVQFVGDLLNSVFRMISIEDLIMCNPLKIVDFMYFSRFISRFKLTLNCGVLDVSIKRLMSSTVILQNEWMPDDMNEVEFIYKNKFLPVFNKYELPANIALFNSRNYEQLTHRIIQYKDINDLDLKIIFTKAALCDEINLTLLLAIMFETKLSLSESNLLGRTLSEIDEESDLSQLIGKAMLN